MGKSQISQAGGFDTCQWLQRGPNLNEGVIIADLIGLKEDQHNGYIVIQ